MRELMLPVVMLLATAIGYTQPARADVVDEAWRRGNDAYLRGDYTGATAAYEHLVREGIVASELFYNLGNSYYRQGAIGRAIWAYERGTSLDPDNEDTRFNLVQARRTAERKARDKIEGADRDPLWMRIVTSATTSTETWLFVGVYIGLFAILFVRRRAREGWRALLTAIAVIAGFATVCSGSLLAGRAYLDRVPFGIVLPEAVQVKEGADLNYRTSFELHTGLKVRLLERDQDWIKIHLPNGLEGWVRDQDIGRL